LGRSLFSLIPDAPPILARYQRRLVLVSVVALALTAVFSVLRVLWQWPPMPTPAASLVPFLPLYVVIGWTALWWGRLKRRVRAAGGGLCPNCLYDISKAGAEACPECGYACDLAEARWRWKKVGVFKS